MEEEGTLTVGEALNGQITLKRKLFISDKVEDVHITWSSNSTFRYFDREKLGSNLNVHEERINKSSAVHSYSELLYSCWNKCTEFSCIDMVKSQKHNIQWKTSVAKEHSRYDTIGVNCKTTKNNATCCLWLHIYALNVWKLVWSDFFKKSPLG